MVHGLSTMDKKAMNHELKDSAPFYNVSFSKVIMESLPVFGEQDAYKTCVNKKYGQRFANTSQKCI